MITVEELSVRGSSGSVLLAPVSVAVAAGEILGLRGPSGCGKSTLLRALLGQVPAGASAAGTVRVGEHDVLSLKGTALQRFRRDRIAFVSQDPGVSLNPTMRVHTLLTELSDPTRARAALAAVDLPDSYLRRRPAELSGGEQRRIALARALARETPVLVLDEPLAGLHGSLRGAVIRLLRRAAAERGTTIVVSGHDTAALRELADGEVVVGGSGVFSMDAARVEAEAGWCSGGAGSDAVEKPCDARGFIEEDDTRGVDRHIPVTIASARPDDSLLGQGDRHRARGLPGAGFIPAGRDPKVGDGAADAPLPLGPLRGSGSSAATPEPDRAGGEAAGESIGRGRGSNSSVEVARPSGAGLLAFGRGRRPLSPAAVVPGPEANAEVPLVVSGVSACIGGRRVLTDVDLTVAAGQALALTGPSGAGKSTLARVIVGLRRPTTGSVRTHGRVALVPQDSTGSLNPRRTVGETLARPLLRHRGRRDPAAVTDLLATVELSPDLAHRHPHELSGGQRQRVALARSLALTPTVLVCDEITSALDPTTATAIMTLLDTLRRTHNLALLLITHDIPLVTRHCTHIHVLDSGHTAESGPVPTVLTTPTHEATLSLLS
ncbi:ABC transporter ATP-binding protein [Nocardia sp. NPDC004068]|uniref:ABC transporter ATP-binding protein n=1 Tax=Nocardia sp. NPDC004068 TaxID=3364303 RepID=UPI003681D9C3